MNSILDYLQSEQYVKDFYKGKSREELIDQFRKNEESIKKLSGDIKKRGEDFRKSWKKSDLVLKTILNFIPGKVFKKALTPASNILREAIIESKIIGVYQMKSIQNTIKRENGILQEIIKSK